MNIYQYVAASDPYGVKAIIGKYGYTYDNVETSDDLGDCLEGVFRAEGLPVLKDIVEMHPDKELIQEYYSQNNALAEISHGDCGCKKCKEKKNASDDSAPIRNQYYEAAGGKPTSDTGLMLHQGNIFLIAAGLLAFAAIIVSSNKNS